MAAPQGFPGVFAPIFPEGREPLPPGWTDEDRQNLQTAKKWEAMAVTARDSCVVKSAISGGVGMGAGAFLSLMGTTFSYEAAYGTHTQQTTSAYFRDQGRKMWSSSKGFGRVGALIAGTECVIESYRATNDIYNPIAAGFITGGVLARKSGPLATLGGAVGFAAFSAVFDYFLFRRETPDED